MAKPQVLMSPEDVDGVSVEYVKCRDVLRLRGPAIAGGASLELPASELLTRLNGEAGTSRRPFRYLLFGALHQDTRGGTGDLMAVYGSEEAARQAFVDLRQQRADRDGWAELSVLDGRGRVTRVAWFGMARRARSRVVAGSDLDSSVPARKRPWRRSRQGRRVIAR